MNRERSDSISSVGSVGSERGKRKKDVMTGGDGMEEGDLRKNKKVVKEIGSEGGEGIEKFLRE